MYIVNLLTPWKESYDKPVLCAQSLQSCLTFCYLWTVAHQAPLSMGFSMQEYWSGLPFPSPAVILEPKKIKSVTVSIFPPFICHEVMGLDTHDLHFLNVEF